MGKINPQHYQSAVKMSQENMVKNDKKRKKRAEGWDSLEDQGINKDFENNETRGVSQLHRKFVDDSVQLSQLLCINSPIS